MTADLQAPMFTDETAAREALEATRWPNGPVCPHCGCTDPKAIAKVGGKKRSHRPGLYYCNACTGQFTVTVGTVFEKSKVPLTKWWLATHLMASSKKGMSAHQLHRLLDVTYKTAWFMAHRIRKAMEEGFEDRGPLGGSGRTVEADETYFGKRETPLVSPHRRGRPFTKKGRSGSGHKRVVVGLVERGGKTRTFHVHQATKKTVRDILVSNADKQSILYTDEVQPLP